MLEECQSFVRMTVHFFADSTRLTWAAIGIALLVAFLYFGLFFRGVSGFAEDVKTAGKEPLADSGYDYVDSKWSYQKILIWILLSVGSGVLAYHQLPDWFPRVFKAS